VLEEGIKLMGEKDAEEVLMETIAATGNEDIGVKKEDKVILTFESEPSGSTAHELGKKHERTVDRILKGRGYTTERNIRLRGKTGALYEIDIFAKKSGQGFRTERLVECKNYSSPVSLEKVGYFWSKMQDLGKKNGLFVVEPRLSDEAEAFCIAKGIEFWKPDYIAELLYRLEIGRDITRVKSKIGYYLPLKIDYAKATNLNFANKESVVVENVKLIWKTFYLVSYKVKCTRIDPRKKKRTVEDSGSFTIDGISASVIQQSDSIKNAFKKMLGQSEEDSQRTKENDIFLKELEQAPETGYLDKSDAYEIITIPPKEEEEQVRKRIIDGIRKDPYVEYYKLKKDEGNPFADERPFKIIPSLKEIRVNIRLIYVPKWEMEFQSKEYNYSRKITGNSGQIIYDSITDCNKHLNIGFGRKKNIAACDICGEVLCKEHIWKCTTCGSWRCESHSKTCTSCQRKYCPEHIKIICADCNNDVCDSCSVVCPICGQSHCKKDMIKCSKCERIVCVSCTRKEGGILSFGQKVICKNC
jgi:hypothetical protein